MKSFVNFTIARSLKTLLVTLIVLVGFIGCEDKFERNPKYQRPEWLVGKIYSQIEANDSLSLFAECISDVGYDSIVNKSGSYAAFIPHDDAMNKYLQKNGYADISDIPYDKKLRLVKFHFVQMPWNKGQLQGLSSKGWISENDISNNKPYAFKRQTLLRNENKTYPVSIRREGIEITETIVPEKQSNNTKTVYANSRKYVPIFFDGFFEASGIFTSDYSFYFERPYELGNLFYAGAKIVSDEIFSDNGFIYIIDEVVEPLKNVEEIMEAGTGGATYKEFKQLINQGSEFDFNPEATYSQEGASEGKEVEELYDLSYPGIEFDIHQELTTNPNSGSANSLTMENHHGILVPSDEAIQKFVDEVIKSTGNINSLDDIPSNLKRMIINTHMSEMPVLESNFNNGFYNSEGDLVTIDPSTIVHREFASNATFIGLNEVITPKALSSVSGLLYLDPAYLTYLMALDYANLLGALKAEDIQYSLFVIPNSVFVYDLSMEIIWRTWRQISYQIRAYSIGEEKYEYLGRGNVAEMMFNQIGIDPLVGVARKEFIETLNQKHIVVDNENQTISGGAPSVFGYAGDSTITVNLAPIGQDYYNGKVYEIDGWLSFPNKSLLTQLSNTKFFDLMIKAGLATKYELRFTNETDRYSIFIPSDEALAVAGADTLSGDALKYFLRTHIVKDELIFTDGRRASGAYPTLNRKKDGSGFITISIHPDVDEISILDEDLNTIVTIPENEGTTNIITVKTQNDQLVTSAVIHEIDTVLTTEVVF